MKIKQIFNLFCFFIITENLNFHKIRRAVALIKNLPWGMIKIQMILVFTFYHTVTSQMWARF